jgi:hypothetical protein
MFHAIRDYHYHPKMANGGSIVFRAKFDHAKLREKAVKLGRRESS